VFIQEVQAVPGQLVHQEVAAAAQVQQLYLGMEEEPEEMLGRKVVRAAAAAAALQL
jgi:hypothetical protein